MSTSRSLTTPYSHFSRAYLSRHMNNCSFPVVISKSHVQIWTASVSSPTANSRLVPPEGSCVAPRFNSAAHPRYLSAFKSLRLLPPLSHRLPQEVIGWTFCVWYSEKKRRRRRLDCRAKLRRLGNMCDELRGLDILDLMDISSSQPSRVLLQPQRATVKQPRDHQLDHQLDQPKCTGCLGTSPHSCRNCTVNINAAVT